MALDQETINQQLELLAAHRRTLAHLLRQAAQFSAGHLPAHIANGVADTRAGIARIKVYFRENAVQIEDEPDDEFPPASSPADAEAERKIAEQRNLDSVLETYIERMSELMVAGNLLKSEPGDDVRAAARTRTLIVLRRLDGEHNQKLFRFLAEAGLLGHISVSQASLYGADLRGAYLYGINLSSTDLRKANLRKANLQRTWLSSADLSEAILYEAGLGWANLSRAKLRETKLNEAKLNEANLYGAKLNGANLYKAKLNGANLVTANLQDAWLVGADLSEAILYGADLRWANLSGANMTRAKLSDASLKADNYIMITEALLSGDKIGVTNLEGANLQGAIMPDGSIHE